MRTTITLDFTKPKPRQKQRKVYPFKAECEALVGRYFILNGQAGFILKAYCDRSKECWVVWFRCVRPFDSDHHGVSGIDDLHLYGASVQCRHYEFKDAVEINAESYRRIREVCKRAGEMLKAAIENEGKYNSIKQQQ